MFTVLPPYFTFVLVHPVALQLIPTALVRRCATKLFSASLLRFCVFAKPWGDFEWLLRINLLII